MEMGDEAKPAARASAVLAAGACAAFFAVMLLLFAAAWGLAEVMPTGFAFLIVGVVTGIVAYIAINAGRRRLAAVDPVPHQTATTLEEDARWARQQLR